MRGGPRLQEVNQAAASGPNPRLERLPRIIDTGGGIEVPEIEYSPIRSSRVGSLVAVRWRENPIQQAYKIFRSRRVDLVVVLRITSVRLSCGDRDDVISACAQPVRQCDTRSATISEHQPVGANRSGSVADNLTGRRQRRLLLPGDLILPFGGISLKTCQENVSANQS